METWRWTKKLNMFERKRWYIPINIGNTHWTVIVANMQEKEILEGGKNVTR